MQSPEQNYTIAIKNTNILMHTSTSSGSFTGGGGSNLPIRKCSRPVQAIITPLAFRTEEFSNNRAATPQEANKATTFYLPLSVHRLGGGQTRFSPLLLTTSLSLALTY